MTLERAFGTCDPIAACNHAESEPKPVSAPPQDRQEGTQPMMTLTDEERSIATQLGLSEEEALNHKRALDATAEARQNGAQLASGADALNAAAYALLSPDDRRMAELLGVPYFQAAEAIEANRRRGDR